MPPPVSIARRLAGFVLATAIPKLTSLHLKPQCNHKPYACALIIDLMPNDPITVNKVGNNDPRCSCCYVCGLQISIHITSQISQPNVTRKA